MFLASTKKIGVLRYFLVRHLNYKVGELFIGTRVDKFVMDKYPYVPFSLIQKELREKKIYCIDESTKKKIRCKPGDHFSSATTLHIPDYFENVTEERQSKIYSFTYSKSVDLSNCIIYDDSHLVAINKPSGLCCQPSPDNSTSILSSLQSLYPSSLLYPVHRLDKETTGVLLIAKDRETARMISHEIANGYLEKIYYTVGIDKSFTANQLPYTGIIYSTMRKIQCYESSIFKAADIRIQACKNHQLPHHLPSSSESPAITGYDVVGKGKGLVGLRCHLYTGKTHQIRVHMKDALGIEILNDKKYSSTKSIPKGIGIDRKCMYLHCKSISLRYNGVKQVFEAPLPPSFSKLPFSLE